MRKIWLIIMLSMTTACAQLQVWTGQTPKTAPELQWEVRHQELQQLNNWSFRGRTIITQGREGWNAGVYWREQTPAFSIRLSGPFAQGGMLLEGQEERVTMTLNSGEQFSAETPEALLAEALGWLLPVSALRDWVRGMPYAAMNVDDMQLDNQGRITLLYQAGWEVSFEEYMPFSGHQVPAKVFIKHPDLSVRLLMNRWDSL
ncbi:MAG: outer membrane lipoprotein LolB [Methylophaga sp.]|nr:outer membrane lipoprotein LolB [Methylophaga sp.]